MSCSLDPDPVGLCQETTSVELGEISFYGTRWSSAQAYHLGQRIRGGRGPDRGHQKPSSPDYHTRFEEISQARRGGVRPPSPLRHDTTVPEEPFCARGSIAYLYFFIMKF